LRPTGDATDTDERADYQRRDNQDRGQKLDHRKAGID
jgi:hypothetical protein